MHNRAHRILNRKWLFLLSLFMIIRVIVLGVGLVFFAMGAYQQNITYLIVAGGCLALLLFLQMIHGLESNKIVCPNCRSQILLLGHCSKHRNAKKLLGSYALRIARQVVFSNTFHCQYCDVTYQWRGQRTESS